MNGSCTREYIQLSGVWSGLNKEGNSHALKQAAERGTKGTDQYKGQVISALVSTQYCPLRYPSSLIMDISVNASKYMCDNPICDRGGALTRLRGCSKCKCARYGYGYL